MTDTTMNTASQEDLIEIETDTRFFMRLLIGAGIAAAAAVSCGVVWHEHAPPSVSPAAQQIQIQAPPAN